MEAYEIQIIETIVVLIGYAVTYYLTKVGINNTLKQTHLQRGRRKMIVKVVHLFSFITAGVIISAIWGIKQHQIAVFVGTTLTVLGIAFFAQWSLLSNVTSGLLLLFNHPIKIGDKIAVLDKDYPFEGEVYDLSYFFVHLKTKNGELITIPNALLFQKPISISANT